MRNFDETASEASPRSTDRGFTLVELLVYLFLGVVILTIVGAVLINSLRAESQVRDAAQSASTAQLISESLGRGVRNASAVEVTNPAAGTIVVRTRSIDGSQAGAWFCQAWVWRSGELRTTRSASALPANPDAAVLAGWTLLATDVEQVGSAPIFSLAPNGRSLDVNLAVGIGRGIPVLVDTVVVAKQPVPSTGKVSAPCF
ncbi:hypothetical protein GCM10009792_04500 [Microcella alkalica]|uniref:Tfp pilus assembly protein PilW n=1 Tax=Microcella alkalica TaxID=355930 RepID=A0A839EEF0_9MICO|nr:type II secretion system protein [Microcella alkalica]MBA8848772.1 Tfp pilus assembly protein PilW [Microcella alkalica]